MSSNVNRFSANGFFVKWALCFLQFQLLSEISISVIEKFSVHNLAFHFPVFVMFRA